MMKRENERIQIDISVDEWGNLLLLMGYALAARRKQTGIMPWHWLRLINSINEGNPQFTPYEIPEEVKT
jgi:hypothetical protein